MPSTTFDTFIEDFVGIDVSKEWLDLWLRPKGKLLHCDNTAQGFKEIHTWLISHGAKPEATVICMENTGIYDERLLKALTGMG